MNLKARFPFFRNNSLVYLDSAATTQTPAVVINVAHSGLENKGNPHRSSHSIATKNEEKIDLARENIARFINCQKEEIVFTGNTTDSINLAVDTILDEIKKGDEIIISIAEHHSNMLPFKKMIERGAIFRVVGLKDGLIDVNDLKEKLSSKTKIVSLQHSSNVLGGINPIEKIGALIKKFNKDIIYIIDSANSISHIPVDTKKAKCDFCAFSSHKMYGPDGVGVLFASKNVWPLMKMVRIGGGVVSDASIVKGKKKDDLVLDLLPGLAGLEGGTPNVSNIIALSEAVNFIRSVSYLEIRKHELELLKSLIDKLSEIEGLSIYGPKRIEDKIGLVSFSIKDESVKDIGDHFNKRKICIRYGSHCAFPLSDELGSETIRVSLGCYNDEDDIERFVQELKFYLDKKKGLIKNENLERFRNFVYYKRNILVNSKKQILSKIIDSIHDKKNTEVIIMAGHFMAVPDLDGNTFYPSIKDLMPENLHKYLDELGMTTFPIYSWKLGVEICSFLKSEGVSAKLTTIANDTTGINELRLLKRNNNKSAEEYRVELLDRYSKNKIPDIYQEILDKGGLIKDDILNFDRNKYICETALRARFKNFISKNKEYFNGMINYSFNKETWDLSIKILDNQEIKTCTFNTFNSKTGGKFCIVEVCQFIAELFGKTDIIDFNYVSEKVLKPKIKSKNKILIMLTPAMCDDAVTRGAELYVKTMLQEKNLGSFKFFNIPLGPDSARYLATGAEIKYISDKDLLQEIEVEKEPDFPELWKMCEYNLLYDVDEYVGEIEDLFKDCGLNKKSRFLDTSVGPGFFVKEMLIKGYNFKIADKSVFMTKPFKKDLEKIGLKHEIIISPWLDLEKYFKKNSFDFLFNRGNTIIYANGGWNEEIKIDKKKSLEKIKATLQIYYNLLKKGGYLYVDKYKDDEIPSKKIVASLKINKTKEQKDIIFYTERRPENNVRYAGMLLRDKFDNESGLPNMAYDLTEDEMETLLKEVGFKVNKLNLKSERHFVVWLAQK
ncbi:MAG: aminotransferase class V-fold PLP-dependent enzyme [Patescibacteria group bacterium]|nr:aminotransferase class V-fold PLP-dependent enzyme [Patescibacteria group bacterium]